MATKEKNSGKMETALLTARVEKRKRDLMTGALKMKGITLQQFLNEVVDKYLQENRII